MSTASAPVTTAPAIASVAYPPPLDPLSRRLLESAIPPAVPSDHGCGYFDPGCPWNICYACEYERDPAVYAETVRKSALVKLIVAYFRCVNAGATAMMYPVASLEGVIAFLDTPVDKRPSLVATVQKALDTLAAVT
jgi:hypothetical protein